LDKHRVWLLVLWCVQAGGGHAQGRVVGARVLPEEVLCSAVAGVSEELEQWLRCWLWEDVRQVHLAMHAAQRAALLALVILWRPQQGAAVLALMCAVWQGVLRHIGQRLACHWKVTLLVSFRALLLLLGAAALLHSVQWFALPICCLLCCKLCCIARGTALLLLLCVAAAQLVCVLCRQSRAPLLVVLSVLLCAQLGAAGLLRRPTTCTAAFSCCCVWSQVVASLLSRLFVFAAVLMLGPFCTPSVCNRVLQRVKCTATQQA
jgi:hypothetical protein